MDNTKTYLYLWIFIGLFSTACTKKVYIADVQSSAYNLDKAAYLMDAKVTSIIQPYKDQLDKTMNEVIGWCEEDMIKKKPSSNLTNWFADALLEGTQKLVHEKVDFSIQNYGGLRLPLLAKGQITVGHIFELMPFDNTVYVMKLTGSQVQQLLDHVATAGGWPISKTVQFEMAYGKATNIYISGHALNVAQLYTVAIPDYLAEGGDNLVFMKSMDKLQTGKLIRDILIGEVRALQTMNKPLPSNHEQRIKN